jgi:NAD(P)H-dependent FMN reductase
MTDERYSIAVVYGSVRTAREGIRAARFIMRELLARGVEATLVDPMEVQLPLLDRMYKEYEPGTATDVLERLATLFRRVDGFIIVSGEYNHSIPPALSNLLDYFLEEYFWRPAAVVTYSGGRWGGVRAGVQLRSMLAEMGMVTTPSMLPFAQVQDAFTEDGAATDPRTQKLTDRFLDEYFWYVRALKDARAATPPPY